jgi:ABC-type sugar transport system ATPase subunit
MASVTFEDVSKRYGDVTAVDHLDLDIVDGEFLVLLGPSGCGKTTALRMIAGLEDISDGELQIGGRRVNEVDPRKRDIAMVFQSYALYPHLTVAKNIAPPLTVREDRVDGEGEPRKLTKAEQSERVDEAARMLGLEPYLKRKPGALSGGQRQRVALARAIVARPQVFLMDEPLSNLDAKLRTQTRAELVDLHRRVGTTIVYVTHDQVEAMTMATRIAVLADGRLQQVGTSEEVYDTPANLFVARFIGTPPMNTFAAKVDADGGHLTVTGAANPELEGDEASTAPPTSTGDDAGRLALSDAQRALVKPGTAVVAGIRPEHLSIVDAAASDGVSLRGAVRNVEWLGHEAVITVEVAGAPIGVRQPADQALPGIGSAVHLAPVVGRVHLFDAETTERLG